jgi:hypothetical protein
VRIRDAQEFRHATRNDLNAIVLHAQAIVSGAAQGRRRDEAINEVKQRAQAAKHRLVLVTSL